MSFPHHLPQNTSCYCKQWSVWRRKGLRQLSDSSTLSMRDSICCSANGSQYKEGSNHNWALSTHSMDSHHVTVERVAARPGHVFHWNIPFDIAHGCYTLHKPFQTSEKWCSSWPDAYLWYNVQRQQKNQHKVITVTQETDNVSVGKGCRDPAKVPKQTSYGNHHLESIILPAVIACGHRLPSSQWWQEGHMLPFVVKYMFSVLEWEQQCERHRDIKKICRDAPKPVYCLCLKWSCQ